MSVSLLMVVTAISGLLYSFARIQREYISPVSIDALLAVTLISATVLFVAIVNNVTVRILEQSKKQIPSDVLRLTMSVALYTICGILILKFVYEKDITALLATSAVFTIALGWGLRQPIGHFFSGLTLEVERLLAVGDYIKINNQSGQVEALKWRAVCVRTKDNSLILLPNSEFANNSIELFPLNKICRHHLDVGIPNYIPPSKVLKAATEVISDQIPFVEDSMDSSVNVTGLDSMAGTIDYRIYYSTKEFFQVDAINAVILERLWYALARKGIDMTGLNQNIRFSQLMRGYQEDETTQTMRMELRTKFLRTIEAFRNVAPESLKLLAQQLVPIIYTVGEPVKAHQERKGSLFIVGRGRVSVQYSGVSHLLRHGNSEEAIDSVASYPDTSHWNRHAVQQVVEILTSYMGPVAQHLVEREARFTSDPYELHYRLAGHIDDKEERQLFLERGPDAHVQELIPGDGLCSIPGFEEKLGKSRVVALQETELLELTGDTVKALKTGSDSLGPALTAYIEQTHNEAGLRNRLAQLRMVQVE
ncbi:MAG: mechanosensitive ion channel [Gammaproteobacteria bacterium]|nr:mechanosensitive ion channel [Gammaproteobacteria bacterium]MDH3379870.1 mechanosensitive ion channel [Gammaproteobacteria bacterium]